MQFGDAELQSLIVAGADNPISICRRRVSRIREAREQEIIAGAAELPR